MGGGLRERWEGSSRGPPAGRLEPVCAGGEAGWCGWLDAGGLWENASDRVVMHTCFGNYLILPNSGSLWGFVWLFFWGFFFGLDFIERLKWSSSVVLMFSLCGRN